MRYMMIVKADRNYEAGAPPKPELMAAIGKLSEEMIKAGVLLDMGGLLPSSKGARINVKQGKADRHRRSIQRGEGAHRRLRDPAGEVEGGSDRARPTLHAASRGCARDRHMTANWRFARCRTSRPSSRDARATPRAERQRD